MRDMVLIGLTSREISTKYTISESHVSVLINSPLWKKEAALMHDVAIAEHNGVMMTMIPKALKCVNEVMARETDYDRVDPSTGESIHINVVNPPSSRLKASELVLSAAGLAGKDKGSGGAKSIVLQLIQPGWGNEDGKPVAINVEVNG